MGKSRKRSQPANGLKRILIVGDWNVDEHWVTGVHRSSMSSRTGQTHYRALQSPSTTISSLSGAGQVASIIHQSQRDGQALFQIVGIGVWGERDTPTLESMASPMGGKGLTPNRLKSPTIPQKTNRLELLNLPDHLNLNKYKVKKVKVERGTSKYIRVYQHTGDKIHLIHRIDWDVKVPFDDGLWVNQERTTDLKKSNLPKILSKEPFNAVIIKDLGKGIISTSFLTFLIDLLPDVPWFVSTKVWKPDWFSSLNNCDVRLVLIPQVPASTAIQSGDVNRWITKSGYASKKGLSAINEIFAQFAKQPTVVVLPEAATLLARYKNAKGVNGILQSEAAPYLLGVGMPMASVFFPALVGGMLENSEMDTGKLLSKALSFTQNWRTFQVNRVKDYENWNPEAVPFLKMQDLEPEVGHWKTFPWKNANLSWDDAFDSHKFGIVTDSKGNKWFDVWRSMTEVDGYVCCMESKRQVLQKLIREFGDFGVGARKHHKSSMLIASPGSGKTFLVKCLGKALGLRHMTFNISQMLSKNDILDCFDTIITTQAKNPDEGILVFFDEINGMLSNQNVYDIFLAPLEEGVYVRAGKTYPIEPCLWIFAGTATPQTGQDDTDRPAKAIDFISRLTIKPQDLQISIDHLEGEEKTENEQEARLEKIYIGVSLIRSIFPDVRRVSKNVLKLFHSLNPRLEVREVKNLVKAFVDIQYGEILSNNIPEDWFKENPQENFVYENWRNEEEKTWVGILAK